MSSPRHGPCSCDIPERVARKDRAGEILPDLSGCLRKCAQNSGHYHTAAQTAPLPKEEPFLPANEDSPPESPLAVSEDMGAKEDAASERRPRFGSG